MNPTDIKSGPISVYDINNTSSLLELLFDTMSSTESSIEGLRERIAPVLTDNKLGSCGEDAVRPTQSPLNVKLTDLLVRLQALNTKLIDTTDTVTL